MNNHTFLISSFRKIRRKSIFFFGLIACFIFVFPTSTEAQTTRKGNFFTKRFSRKNNFSRNPITTKKKSRKGRYKCSNVGKAKVHQIKVSKKQLKRWEEEKMVRREREAKKQANSLENSVSEPVLTASGSNDMISEEVNTSRLKTLQKSSKDDNEQSQKAQGWYSSATAEAPKIEPILIEGNKITNQQGIQTAAKYSRLGYIVYINYENAKQLNLAKQSLLSAQAEQANLRFVKSSKATAHLTLRIDSK